MIPRVLRLKRVVLAALAAVALAAASITACGEDSTDPSSEAEETPETSVSPDRESTSPGRQVDSTLPAPQLSVEQVGDHAVVEYSIPPSENGATPAALLLTIDSSTDEYGPATFETLLKGDLSGTRELPLPLEASRYRILGRTFSQGALASSEPVVLWLQAQP